jgi:hypothetical protein
LGGKGDEFFEVRWIVTYGDAYVTPASAARFVDYLDPIGKCVEPIVRIAEDAETGRIVHCFQPCHVFGQMLEVRVAEQMLACRAERIQGVGIRGCPPIAEACQMSTGSGSLTDPEVPVTQRFRPFDCGRVTGLETDQPATTSGCHIEAAARFALEQAMRCKRCGFIKWQVE